VLAADQQAAGSGGQSAQSKTMVKPDNPVPQQGQQPPFVPIVDGRLLAYYRQYPMSYADQLLAQYGGLPPFGDYLYSPRYGYNPQLYAPSSYAGDQPRRLLIVVEPSDAPGTTYYYDSFPIYYGQPGYFPANTHGNQYVTVISPTVSQQQQPARPAQPAAAAPVPPAPAQVRVPAELSKAAFVSTLAPMLGGDSRVSTDFAVGELKLRRSDYDGAADAFGRAVGAAPDDSTPKLALGLAMAGSGDYGGAAQVLKRALRGMPDWRNLTLRPAAIFADEAAYQKILGSLKKATAANKDAAFVLGVLSLATGQNVDAITSLAQTNLDDPLALGLLVEAERRDDAARKAAGEDLPGK